MDEYKCQKCKTPLTNTTGRLQCLKCDSKVFYKDRPNTKKVLKSD